MADLQMGLFASTTPDTPIQPAETRSFDEAAAHPPAPEDAEARKQAIDIERSILVQAPAGAGKTNLLTQRYLALLSEVEEPEQILAITFTKAATAEMRARIVGALEAAQRHPQPDTQDETSVLAHKALRHAEQRNWRLLEQTHRLDVQTIDSLCLRLAHSQPLLSRFGGALAPAENADTLYEQAARRTMAQLGRGHDSDLEEALELLLLLRDNNLHECERLLATLLRGRDAWLGVLPLGPAEDVNWDEVRERLQQPFQNSNRQTLEALAESFAHTPGLAHELVVMAGYAADNLEDSCEHRAALLAIRELPDLAQCSREQWLAIAWLLLTGDHAWRRQWTVNMGFPAAGKNPGKELREQHKQRIEECALSLQHNDSENPLLQPLLCQLRSLPATAYTTDQWQTLLAVFRVLRRAVAELRIIFAEANMVDFTEIAQAAEQVLKDESSMRGLLESERKQHILIDEFQDTSRAQYRLVAELLREWRHGDGRTVFLVGDPLQSIYSFRQAEVALFHETREHGLPCGEDRRHPCHTLQLTHNFRSHASLVEALNQRLARMFPPAPAKGGFSDTFVAAHAWPLQGFEDALEVHPIFVEKQRNEYAREGDADEDFAEDQAVNDASNRKSRREETEAVIRVLQQEQPRVEAALAAGASEYQVAVLVRSRPHLAEILPALRAASIPFRAVELEPLADQPEVHDMLMLLRALLHPADRVAWLSVLRAPWCALLMPDLHMLAGNDDVKLRRATIAELIETRSALLSEDGQQRVLRTGSVLATAQRDRLAGGSDLALAAWLEQTWMALGGSACVDANARENIEAFLRLLDTLAPSGMEVLRGDFALRLARLCAAPDATVSDRFGVQVMTMHKAKGLGFEVVLLPGLDRVTMSDPRALLAMLQRAQPGQKGESELLLAPIGSREEATSDPTYAWVMQQKATRDAEERRRLFYVACTRARKRLHLFALVQHSKGEIAVPRGTSLLAAAWPALGEEILEQWAQNQAASARTLALVDTPQPLEAAPSTGLSLAASAADNAPLLAPASPAAKPQKGLYRLPADWAPRTAAADVAWNSATTNAAQELFRRSEGSLAARARGNAMHALLERLSDLFAARDAQAPNEASEFEAWRSALANSAERVLREAAFEPRAAHHEAQLLASHALRVATDPIGRWLLQPHAGGASETTWQHWDADGHLRTLRVDRSFLAGETAGSTGEDCLWIVDYKTGSRRPDAFAEDAARATWLTEQKLKWAPQLEAYGAALRHTGSAERPLRYGLYFPELLAFKCWHE